MTFAQFPPEETEETCRCCFVSLIHLLADLRRSWSQTTWVRDEACCPGKMTSPRHRHYKHFICCEKDKGTHFSFWTKKKPSAPHYSVWPWQPAFIRLVSQVSGQQRDELSDPAVCFGPAPGTQLFEQHNWSLWHALVFLLNTVRLAMNTKKFLIWTERLVTERSHRKSLPLCLNCKCSANLKIGSLKYWLQSTQIKEVRGRSHHGPRGNSKTGGDRVSQEPRCRWG